MVLASLVLAAYVPRGARYQRGEELLQGKTFEVNRVSHLIHDYVDRADTPAEMRGLRECKSAKRGRFCRHKERYFKLQLFL